MLYRPCGVDLKSLLTGSPLPIKYNRRFADNLNPLSSEFDDVKKSLKKKWKIRFLRCENMNVYDFIETHYYEN